MIRTEQLRKVYRVGKEKVVALANSDANPANERLVQAAIKREYPRDFLGSLPVFLSSNISPRAGEQERVNAAVISGYIHPKLVRLLYKAGEDLRRRLYHKSLFIGHNNGAVARVAKTRAINTYNSGPTGGLMGARLMADLYGTSDLISADMGGTSFDLGYVHRGTASYSVRPSVEGFPVNLPMLSIRAIGAGGGSIAHIEDGRLEVGPQSAGALPGPVAFDLGGTEPTVTDADVVLGILDPDFFLGGGMKLRPDKARAAMGPDQILLGNIDPVRILRGAAPETVRAAIAQCHQQTRPRYIVGAGCEVPRATPEANLRVLTDYARSTMP